MSGLLALSRAIDAVNHRVFRLVMWLILICTLVSAGNAIVRYLFNISSNAWLELQWYLFSAVFLFAAAYTLQQNEMVRIDVIAGRLSRRTQAWIDVLGTLLFLLPMALMILYLSWPVFVQAYERGEMSTNAGGLIVWPARLLVPIGFLLLSLQGVSQLIKNIAFLTGAGPDPTVKEQQKSAEELLAEEILKSRGEQA
ncbi:MAG TPA: TRAP transporter small permease subunit [Burkholderiaceae bacterium]|nr:TRAP transporter small permease subunit [Burkholderiaceae bacterium]HQR70613.1 TRAP transporter small permease subunit [Burkholderiaceae bacterium]